MAAPWRHSGAQRAVNLRGIAAARAALADARRRIGVDREFAAIEQRRAVDRALDHYQAVR